MISIRKAKSEDVDSIVQLLRDLQETNINLDISAVQRQYIQKKNNAGNFWKSALQKSLHNNLEYLLVAILDGKVVGYLKAEIKQRSQVNQHEKKLYIRHLIVSENFRNQGVGTELVKKAEKFAKEKNILFVTLKTSPKNSDTRNFYKSLGFEDIYVEMVKSVVA